MLAEHQPAESTDRPTLRSLAEKAKRRGLVIIFSDLFDDIEKIKSALLLQATRKHDVIVYKILDRHEVDFPFRDTGAFEDLETGEKIMTN